MSELVEDNFFANFQQNFSIQANASSCQNDVLNGLALLIEKANTEGYNFKIQESNALKSQGKLKAVAHLKFNTSIFDFVVEILIDVRNKKLQSKTSFLEQEQYFCTLSSSKRKIICRKFLKINNQIEHEGLKFIQDMQNGKIILISTVQESQSVFNSKDMIWSKVKGNLKKVCQICGNYSLEILQVLNKQRYKKYFFKNGGQQLKRIKKDQLSYAKLVKQLQVSHINFGFNSKADESSFPTFQKSQQQQAKLKEFLMQTSSEKFQHNSKKLFFCDFDEFLQVPLRTISCELQHSQTKLYSSYLKTPVPRDPNPGQNKFIFNHVEFVKPETVKFKDTFLEGGKNKIFAAKASFYYCQSGSYRKGKDSVAYIPSFLFRQSHRLNEQGKIRQHNPILTKMIAVKVPKRKTSQRWEQKYENEKNIIKLFKSGVSAYVLKYYVSVQPNFEHKDCLLLDFLPNCQPLSNHLEIFKQTLSLHSKAYIIVNLANSLRFLNDYHIVHMDFNLNNILVYRDYLTKLIDFGQAYSPNVNTSNGIFFKRGYTFPFCSPQYFQRKNNFINKQDIFSLGIMMWRIVFNDYPFFTSQKALQSYKNKTYLQKIMLAPERGEAFGNTQTMDFIYRLIFKCISPNEFLRCQTSWLTIFFKIIYFYLL